MERRRQWSADSKEASVPDRRLRTRSWMLRDGVGTTAAQEIQMRDEYERPELMACGHCHNQASPRVVFQEDVHGVRNDGGPPMTARIELLECEACSELMLRESLFGPAPDGIQHREVRNLYPPESKLAGVPSWLAKEYGKRRRLKQIDMSAAGSHLRRVLGMICDDQLGEPGHGSRLVDRIEQLVEKKQLPKIVAIVATKIRLLGNISVHAGRTTEVTPDDVLVLEKLTQALLEYVYGLPSLIAEAQEALDRIAKRRTGDRSS